MRRADREITDLAAIRGILSAAKNCTLSLNDSGEPYGVILSYGFALSDTGALSLYFHSAAEGRKIDIIKKNPRVAFSLFSDYSLISGPAACDYTAHFSSVAGIGGISMVEDAAAIAKALDILMENHGYKTPAKYNAVHLSKMAILRLDAEHYTAKRNM